MSADQPSFDLVDKMTKSQSQKVATLAGPPSQSSASQFRYMRRAEKSLGQEWGFFLIKWPPERYFI